MFDDKSLLISTLRNPTNIAAKALNEIESRLNGTITIADPNAPFCHLLEFGSSIAAQVINAMDAKLPALYPKRAESMEDLYGHMSDFDYLRMYSTPARSALRMFLPKKFLLDKAVEYNANYKKLVIPSDTTFLVAKYNFGIYYPIEILINNYTGSFTVAYDTSESNPLHVLSKNIVDKYEIQYMGVDYLILDFPIYQFSKSSIVETIVSSTGFVKSINYNDKFYALRVFNYKNGTYTELAQTQSKIVYDATVPTLYLQIHPDKNKLVLNIPQVYFDNGMMGSKLLIEVYTTVGVLDIDTSNLLDTDIGVTYNNNARTDSTFTNIFKNMPYDIILQLSGDRITGGSNAISVSTLRQRVIQDTLYDRVPISEADISVMLEDNGFYVHKSLDNVTDRIYYAYKVIRDSTGSIVPSTTIPLKLLGTDVTDGKHSTLVNCSADSSVTILPTTIYKYNQDANCAIPLVDDELNKLVSLDKDVLATTLNTAGYLKSPYHVRVSMNGNYPRADTYNLMTPTVDKIIFVEDNYETTYKLVSYAATINHDNIGYYEVTLSVSASDDVTNLSVNDILLYVMVKSDDKWVGTTCEYVSFNPATNIFIYKFKIPTTYHLTLDNKIGITYTNDEDTYTNYEYLINLVSDFHVVYMVSRSAVTDVSEPVDSIITGVPDQYKQLYIGLSRQYFTITLGTNINNVIYNNVEVTLGANTYARYETNIPAKYTEDVYEKDENGYIKTYTDVNGKMYTKKIHEVGEAITDETGKVRFEHMAGDVIRDSYGNPIVVSAGVDTYFITMMFIDAKMFFSDRQAELDFQSNIYASLNAYFNTIASMQDQLLERTKLYFRCVKSIGTANVNIGDGAVSKQNIELSFRIVCYVASYVKQDESIQNQITEMLCTFIEEAIESKTISMLDIFEKVKEKVSDYIDHFDLLGINDNVALQTFVVTDEDSQPSIRRQLVLTEDNILSLRKQIDVTYVTLTPNTLASNTYSS
jgi:hypothetical protein